MNQFFHKEIREIFEIFKGTQFEIGGTSFTFISILNLILCFILVLFLTRFLKRFLKHNLLVKLGINISNREPISTIFSYTVGSLFFLFLLEETGFNISLIAFILGGLGVFFGFGLKELTIDFISGLILLFEHLVKVGDFVEFDNLSGYVQSISIRSTIIRTRDGADVVVPNSQMVSNRLINWSYDNFIGRIKVPVNINDQTDPLFVTEILLKAVYSEPNILDNPPPQVMLMGFGDNSLKFELWIWINRYDKEPQIRSSLNFAIQYFLRNNNIDIASTQYSLLIKNPELCVKIKPEETANSFDIITNHKINSLALTKELSMREMLKNISYFQTFNELELRKLIEIGYRQKLSKSEILFEENTQGDTFYIILSGKVEIFIAKINKHLNFLTTGGFFGELSLMLDIPRSATVRGVEDTILFVINRQGFEKILQQYPQLSDIIMNELAYRKQELLRREQNLRESALLNGEENNQNLIQWIHQRWKKLFNLP